MSVRTILAAAKAPLGAGLAVAGLVFCAAAAAMKPPAVERPYVDYASPVSDRSPATRVDARDSSKPGPAAIPVQGDWFYIVGLRETPVASYRGDNARFAAIPRDASRGNRMDTRSPEARAYGDYLQSQQQAFLSRLSAETRRSHALLADYQFAFNGVVIKLSPSELALVRQMPDVALVEPVATHELNTDVGPGFIGADTIWNGTSTGGAPGTRGEGIVIGVIDSGLNWGSPSFADVGGDGYNHSNPFGTGNYLGVCEGQAGGGDPVNGPACNDKVIGAYAKSFDFVQQVNFECANPGDPGNTLGLTPAICTSLGVPLTDFPNARDENGHGTHTASTSGGNEVDITYRGNNLTVSGVAPHANLIIYDTCHTNINGQGSCFNFATLAALEQVVEDGVVDVINYSIGGGAQPWTEAGSLAFLAAVDAGVFVSASAGNSGPNPSTNGHNQPWVMTVANGTHNRAAINYQFTVTGPVTPVPANLVGQSMFLGAVGTAHTVAYVGTPLIVSPGVDTTNDGCAAYPPGTFTGGIALIRRGTCAFAIKAQNASDAGAIGVFITNNAAGNIAPGGTSAVTFPVFGITQAQGNALRDYVVANGSATVDVPLAAPILATQGDVVNNSSSRGPSAFEIIKPDIMGPGTNILAAYVGSPNAYEQLTGTSMSSPHVAGSAALVRALHPSWTVAEVKSALMLTSKNTGLTKQDGVTPADAFDVGAGRVDLSVAATSGLVLDETPLRMSQANPADGGDPGTLNLASLNERECIGSCSFTRKVRSVASEAVTYLVSFDSSSGLVATVTPSTFTILPGTTRTLEIEVDSLGATGGQWAFGTLNFVPLPVGMGNYSETTTPATPVAIPDGAYNGGFGGPNQGCVTVDTTGDVPPGALVAGIDVELAASHTWVGDLTLKLQSPDGSVLGLMSLPGVNEAADDGTGSSGTDANLSPAAPITFTDASATSAEAMGDGLEDDDVVCATAGSPCSYAPAPGSIAQPPSTFSNLVGEAAEGVWTLCAGDNVGFDAGTLNAVTLNLELGAAPSQPALHMPVAIFAVDPVATITVNPSSLNGQVETGGAAITRTLTVGNTGTVDLDWQIQATPGAGPIWTQLEDSTGGIVSDFFVGDGTGAYSASDFTLNVQTTLTEIFTPGFDNTASLGSQPSITWAIYPSVGGIPAGDPEVNPTPALWEFTANIGSAFVDITGDDIRLDLQAAGESVVLPAGTYWLTVFPTYSNALADGNRWNWSQGVASGAGTHLISQTLFGGPPTWTPLTDLGIAWSDTAFTLTGIQSCGAPWLSVAPGSGTVAPAASADLTVTMDPTGLADGSYQGNVCIASNDPAQPLAVVPVSFAVGTEIFSDGFED
jgi:subtilisin family serine protease/subtilisin-like proprotein convertase family protein